jgi:hypothetical protein
MAAVLDLITGGGLLPQVYCKKVTLENHPEEATDILVTLNFELYQLASALSESNWLNNFNVLGSDIYDSVYIQIVAYSTKNNIKKLLASNNPVPNTFPPQPENVGNVYVLQHQAGDGYLPRRWPSSWGIPADFANISPLFGYDPYNVINEATLAGPAGDSVPRPIKLKNSSIITSLSNPATTNFLENLGSGNQLQPREETKNGKVYYVIPFTQKIRFRRTWNGMTFDNLGFLFYTMLSIPDFLQKTGMSFNFNSDSLLERYIIEGPVNTEIVLRNGKPAQSRETFFLPDGRIWEGSVHLHTPSSPAPDGYKGNGGLGENKGWMTGERHIGMSGQSELSLRSVPNYKIQDFRSDVSKQPLDGFMALGVDSPVFSLNANVQGTINKFLAPFQKETRKYLSKFGDRSTAGKDAQYNAVGASYYDNDSEFSKLYLTRDRNNSARGMFFINIQEFLRNNSKIYPILFDMPKSSTWGLLEAAMRNVIVDRSKILEIRLYRDRIKKKPMGMKREKYANDTLHEEPSHLVGTFYDKETYQTPSQKSGVTEVTLGGDFDPRKQRFFMFSDLDVGTKSAGFYQYRIEIDFQDGTYSVLNEVLKGLVSTKILLHEYYEMAIGYYTVQMLKVIPGGHSQARRPYFQNGSFVQKFEQDVLAHPRLYSKPWSTTVNILEGLKYVFGMGAGFDMLGNESMLDPVNGSPQGISFFVKILGAIITKLEDLLDVSRIKKTGSELDSKTILDGYSFNNFFDYEVSSTDTKISDSHTYNQLFEGLSNENIYSDYLDVGSDYAYSGHFADYGLRRMAVNTYVTRCQLDAAKFMKPLGPLNFSDIWSDMGFGLLGEGIETLATSGYSYLSPSIVELSDPSQGYDPNHTRKRVYSYYYKAFKSYAAAYLKSEDLPDTFLYSNIFDDLENYERLLAALMNYSLNKNDNPDAGLVDAFSVGPTNYGGINPKVIETREAYKNLFERTGLVIHSMKNYEKFYGEDFDKPAGIVGPDIPDKLEYHSNFEASYPGSAGMWLANDYSDGTLLTHTFLKEMLFSQQTLVDRPKLGSVPVSYQANLSNIHKLLWMHQNMGGLYADGLGTRGLFKEVFDNAITPDSNIKYLAFFFFHVSLNARVEVFEPMDDPGVAKDDQENWVLLSQNHIENISEDQKLFCRLILPSTSVATGINLPILDKYFLISGKEAPDLGTSNINIQYDVTAPPSLPIPGADATESTAVGTGATEAASSEETSQATEMAPAGTTQGI